MTRTTLRHSISALALSALLGGVALAQTAPATAPEAPAATAPAPATAPVAITAETLPAPLAALGLTDVEIETGKRGSKKVEGDLPDGTEIEAMIDWEGTLRHVEAEDDAALPPSLIEALIPATVRAQAIMADFATINEVGVMPMGVMVGGTDAAGEKLRAGFAQDGTLIRFGRGEMAEGHGKGGKHGKHGKLGEGRGAKGEGRHGKGEGRGKHGHDHGAMGGQMGGMPGAFGAMTGMQGMSGMGGGMGHPPAPLDDAAATTAVTAAGYTALGTITREGPRTLIEAVNPAGESVTVELNPRGEVVRETAR